MATCAVAAGGCGLALEVFVAAVPRGWDSSVFVAVLDDIEAGGGFTGDAFALGMTTGE